MAESNATILLLALVLMLIVVGGNALIFSINQPPITGKAVQGFVRLKIIHVTGTSALNISLTIGQNWFSIPVFYLGNDSPAVVLESIGYNAGSGHLTFAGWPGCTGNAADDFVGNYTVIWTYNASDIADPWKDYSPDKPCFQIPAEKVQHILPTQNYQITMNNSELLELNGTMVNLTTINLVNGLNWIGYPTVNPLNITLALADLGPNAGTGHLTFVGWPGCTGNAADDFSGNYTVVWTYNAFDAGDPWKDYNPDKPCFQIGSEKLLMMNPGAGFQITTNSTESWRIDW